MDEDTQDAAWAQQEQDEAEQLANSWVLTMSLLRRQREYGMNMARGWVGIGIQSTARESVRDARNANHRLIRVKQNARRYGVAI